MNIFENKNSFIGSVDSSELTKNSLMSILQLAKKIRLLLGKQGYLLDCYLSAFFEAANSTTAYEAADAGFEDIGKFRNVFFGLPEGSCKHTIYPIYEKTQEGYEKHTKEKLSQQKYTEFALFMLTLTDEVLLRSVDSFKAKCESNMNTVENEIYFQNLYNKISDLTGESMMDELNEMLKQRFLIASAVAVFVQGMTNTLLMSLTVRDSETGKPMFQILMNTLPNSL